MAQCSIVGNRRVDMENEKIHGWSLFINRKERNVNGLLAEKLFLSDEMLRTDLDGVVPQPGQTMTFEFSRNGKLGEVFELS